MKRPRKECAKTINYICEELGENLHSRRCASIRRHLTGCPDCTGYLKSLRKMVDLYKSYPVPPISKEARRRIRKIPDELG
jgi:hypothetical protein